MSAIIATDINRVPKDCDCYPVVTIFWFNRVNMKKCTKCGEVSDNYTPDKKRSDGLKSRCRICKNKDTKVFLRTKIGLISKMYYAQRRSSKHRGHKMPEYSKEDLLNWCLNQDLFHSLFEDWVKSGYKKNLIPSCDRTDDFRGYSLDRLQLTTWYKNKAKLHLDVRTGKRLLSGRVRQKQIEQRTLDGELVQVYISGKDAERKTGIDQGNISAACYGKQKQANGFKWNFVNEHPAN